MVKSKTVKIGESVDQSAGVLRLSDIEDFSEYSVYLEEIRVLCDGQGDSSDPLFNVGVLPNGVADTDVSDTRLFYRSVLASKERKANARWYDSIGDLEAASFSDENNAAYDNYVDLSKEDIFVQVALDNGASFDIYLVLRVIE